MKERNRDQAWRMIVGFDRRRPTSDDIQMPTRRGNVGGRRSEASGFPARPGGVMPRHDKSFLSEHTGIYLLRSRSKRAAVTRLRVRQEVVHEVKY